MGPSQTARRASRDRARRDPLIRPDYLKLYRVKTGPEAAPRTELALGDSEDEGEGSGLASWNLAAGGALVSTPLGMCWSDWAEEPERRRRWPERQG